MDANCRGETDVSYAEREGHMQAIQAGLLIVDVNDVREQSGLLIEEGAKKAILPNEEIDAKIKSGEVTQLQDARDALVMPGFVNAHTHQYGRLSHGLAADCLLYTSRCV